MKISRKEDRGRKATSKMIAALGRQNHRPRKKIYSTTRGGSIKMVQLKNAQYCTKRLGEWVPLEPQPLEDEVMVMKRFYACLKRKPEYKKRVTWIEKVAKQMDFLVQEILWLNTLASFPKL